MYLIHQDYIQMAAEQISLVLKMLCKGQRCPWHSNCRPSILNALHMHGFCMVQENRFACHHADARLLMVDVSAYLLLLSG